MPWPFFDHSLHSPLLSILSQHLERVRNNNRELERKQLVHLHSLHLLFHPSFKSSSRRKLNHCLELKEETWSSRETQGGAQGLKAQTQKFEWVLKPQLACGMQEASDPSLGAPHLVLKVQGSPLYSYVVIICMLSKIKKIMFIFIV